MEHGSWSYNDGLLKIYSYDEDGDYEERTMGVAYITQDTIILKQYESDPDYPEEYERDEYGYYELLTLNRYID